MMGVVVNLAEYTSTPTHGSQANAGSLTQACADGTANDKAEFMNHVFPQLLPPVPG